MLYCNRSTPRSSFASPNRPGLIPLSLVLLVLFGLGLPTLARELPSMPEAVSSFGAAVHGDALYVYGGHTGRTHQHSTDNLAHRFLRLDLADPLSDWQQLGESVRGLQGLALIAYGDEVCRVGGLDARNGRDEDEDLHSTAEVACFDVDAGTWRRLPDLPAPRSSHDAIVVGDHLVVVGGWQLHGADAEALWHDDTLVLDLATEQPAWSTIEQPFRRRALAVATDGERAWAIGGLTPDSTTLATSVLDLASGSWADGPDLPSKATRHAGFGLSAFGVDGTVYVADNDGSLFALRPRADGEHTDDTWRETALGLDTPRVFHRLVAHDGELLVLGGASRGGHLDTVETLDLATERGAWPGFRGHGDGVADSSELPRRWSTTEGIAWRAELPGIGQSSPAIWRQRVYVTSVVGEQKQTLVLSALDLDTGAVVWRRLFASSHPSENSDMVSRAAPTPVVDGERVVAFWESGDLIAVDLDGETLWRRSLVADYGPFAGNHGIGSSPVLAGEAVVVQITHDGPSYFAAFSRTDGALSWKIDRPAGVAWTTPVVVDTADGPLLVSSAAGRAEALDAVTGDLRWRYDGLEKNNVPSATIAGDLVVVASSSPSHNLALRPGDGTLDDSSIAWRARGVTSGFGSPTVHGGCVLFVNKKGVVTCVEAATGVERWSERLGGPVWASPIRAGESVYFVTTEGETVIAQPSVDGLGLVAENSLDLGDERVYGIAAVRGLLALRTGAELVLIEGVDAEIEAAR